MASSSKRTLRRNVMTPPLGHVTFGMTRLCYGTPTLMDFLFSRDISLERLVFDKVIALTMSLLREKRTWLSPK